MRDKVNIAEKLAGVTEYFRPKIVASLNEMKVEVVKVRGEFVWHAHADTDDFFLVLDGELTVELEDGDVHLGAGELYVVPRGVQAPPAGGAGGARPPDRAEGHAQHGRRRRRAHRARRGDLIGRPTLHPRRGGTRP